MEEKGLVFMLGKDDVEGVIVKKREQGRDSFGLRRLGN